MYKRQRALDSWIQIAFLTLKSHPLSLTAKRERDTTIIITTTAAAAAATTRQHVRSHKSINRQQVHFSNRKRWLHCGRYGGCLQETVAATTAALSTAARPHNLNLKLSEAQATTQRGVSVLTSETSFPSR